jgi:hypothetical protein
MYALMGLIDPTTGNRATELRHACDMLMWIYNQAVQSEWTNNTEFRYTTGTPGNTGDYSPYICEDRARSWGDNMFIATAILKNAGTFTSQDLGTIDTVFKRWTQEIEECSQTAYPIGNHPAPLYGTTLTQAISSTGSQSVTVASTTALGPDSVAIGWVLNIGQGTANQELVTVTGTSSGHITANFTKTHASADPVNTQQSPTIVSREPSALDPYHDYWAANNYVAGMFRNLTMMSLIFYGDRTDDPGSGSGGSCNLQAVNSDGSADCVQAHEGTAMRTWLYWLWGNFEDVNATTTALGISNSTANFGIMSGGMPVEAMSYGADIGTILEGLIALRASGQDDPNVWGPQANFEASSFWPLMQQWFAHEIEPMQHTYTLGGGYGTVVGSQPMGWGDDPHAYILDTWGHLVSNFGNLYYYLTGSTSNSYVTAARWLIQNALDSGGTPVSANWLSYHIGGNSIWGASYWSEATYIYWLMDGTNPNPSDPRTNYPTEWQDLNFTRELVRTDWTSTASWYSYRCGWTLIDHTHGDCGQFEFYRKGEWIIQEYATEGGYCCYNTGGSIWGDSGIYSAATEENTSISINNVQIANDVATLTATAPVAAGLSTDDVCITGLVTATFLNGQCGLLVGTVSGNTFQFPFTHANYGPTADTNGRANQDMTNTIYYQVPPTGSQWPNAIFAGQPAGLPTSRAISISPNYAYAQSDAAPMMNTGDTTGVSATDSDVIQQLRSCMYLRTMDVVTCYDRDTTTSSPRFKRTNFTTPATLTGSVPNFTITTTGGQLGFLSVLLPTSITSTVNSTTLTAQSNSAQQAETELIIDATSEAADVRFLFTLETKDSGGSQSTTALVQSSAGTNFDCASVSTTTVCFKKTISDSFSTTTFTVANMMTQFYLTNLTPASTYSATVTPSGGNYNVTVATSGSLTADNAGVLNFTQSGGAGTPPPASLPRMFARKRQ